MASNRGHEFREVLGDRARGATLLTYLMGRYAHSSSVQWRERVARGQVLLDGRRTAPAATVRPGQTLSWNRPPWREPDAPLSFEVLHRDAELIAVAKPAGLPTLPGGGFLEHTLLARVRRLHPDATPLHRLGRWTSGIVLFALDERARSAVAAAWREGRVRKQYRALASGSCPAPRVRIAHPIGPVPYAPLGTVHAVSLRGKPAVSELELVESRADAFLADVRILTGRPHQIRIHLAAVGCPLLGDPLYAAGGGPRQEGRALPGDGGYLLHATQLSLDHPRGGRLDLRCAPPAPLRRGSRVAAEGNEAGCANAPTDLRDRR